MCAEPKSLGLTGRHSGFMVWCKVKITFDVIYNVTAVGAGKLLGIHLHAVDLAQSQGKAYRGVKVDGLALLWKFLRAVKRLRQLGTGSL